jgi:hypothetical protein
LPSIKNRKSRNMMLNVYQDRSVKNEALLSQMKLEQKSLEVKGRTQDKRLLTKKVRVGQTNSQLLSQKLDKVSHFITIEQS